MKPALLLTLFAFAAAAQSVDLPLLIRQPTISRDKIAFSYGGDIWAVAREGGDAQRLTAGVGRKYRPFFSPDGKWIAYTGDYYGNPDVYVIPSAGGEPRRLTFHPASDVTQGWTPDGKSIVFASIRTSPTDPPKLFSVPAAGGFATELPLPMASSSSFSPDATRLAYTPKFLWQEAWKKYRGGQTMAIWIARLSDSHIEKIPRDNSNDFNPMWVGKKIYFLSDRDGAVSLYDYDTETRKVSAAVKNDGFDFKSASAGPDAIVYEQFGSLHVLDLKSNKPKTVPVHIAGQFSELLPRYEKLDAKRILNANISPNGARAVFEIHGEILTVPAEKGDVRNLTNSPSVADRDPAWSPDGRQLAWFSDESGEYALHVRNQNGLGDIKKISLGEPPSYYYSPLWSPDNKKIAFFDKRLNIWYVDLEKGTTHKVASDYFDSPFHNLNPAWSPDSKWLSYSAQLPSHLHAVYFYELATGKATQVTDGLSDALYADWDKSGKYLYLTASTNTGLAASWLDMSSLDHPVTRAAYVVVLSKDDPSPLAPESDEEKEKDKDKDKDKDKNKDKDKDKPATKDAKKDDNAKEPPAVKIDFEGLGQRILSLPVPERNYLGLSVGKENEVILAEGPLDPLTPGQPKMTLVRFDMKKRKTENLLDNVTAFFVSANGEKMLVQQNNAWRITNTSLPIEPGKGTLNLADMTVFVDPRAEWKQMYHEVWRIERDFLYDPHSHGLDLSAVEKKYAPFVDSITTRNDLSYLFTEMLGNLTLGHVFIRGGDEPDPPHVRVGLLGADYSIENGRYRFSKVYNGENWNPRLRAPLTQPGVNVKTGEYLLSVNGRDVRPPADVYSFFQETANHQTVLRVGPDPSGEGSREVTVLPVVTENALRHLDWVESNRRKVDQMTNGRVAYVHLPDTANGGFTEFNRYYFAQVGKEGAILDERFNHGGDLADYIIDYLRRPLMSIVTAREGADFRSPGGAIFGPKVMITNEFAGSGGDAMPWYFRKAGIGQLIGTRTWGGLVGIYDYPQLIDGGSVTAPRVAIYGLKGDWEVENHGITPDIEVEMDPELVRQGHDPQLEKAVQVVLEELKKHPLPEYKKPSYPDYQHPTSSR